MLDLHYDRLVSDGISGWDLWLLANGWGDAVAAASLQPQHESGRTLNGNKAAGRQWWPGKSRQNCEVKDYGIDVDGSIAITGLINNYIQLHHVTKQN